MAARSLGLTWDGEDDDSRLTILPALFGAMRDSDPDVAGEAATALGRAGLLALPGLLTALDDREPAMRRLAAVALVAWVDTHDRRAPEATPVARALHATLDDPDATVKRWAAFGLIKLDAD